MTAGRRPDGALEMAVLRVLWDAKDAMLPAAIRDQLPMKLAYTSVATVLTRLLAKGFVARAPIGNAFAYRATIDEATLIAQRMTSLLSESSDHRKSLAGFVGRLGTHDARLLRSLLDEER